MITYMFSGECQNSIKQAFLDAYRQHADTWYKYAGDTRWRRTSISGTISGSWDTPTTQIPDVTNVIALEIGSDVTSIGRYAFNSCSGLTSITIPNSVTYINYQAFKNCSGLTSVIFEDKTLAEVQAMSNYSWGISDTSIITTI